MDSDDQPVGRVLSRRDALKLLGFGSAALLAACTITTQQGLSTLVATSGSTQAAPTTLANLDCVVRPELTIGPSVCSR